MINVGSTLTVQGWNRGLMLAGQAMYTLQSTNAVNRQDYWVICRLVRWLLISDFLLLTQVSSQIKVQEFWCGLSTLVHNHKVKKAAAEVLMAWLTISEFGSLKLIPTVVACKTQ